MKQSVFTSLLALNSLRMIRISLYLVVQGGYLSRGGCISCFQMMEEGHSVLLAQAVSQITLILFNQYAKVVAYPEPHHLHRVQVSEMLVNPSQLLPYVENPRKKNHQREKEEEAVFKLGNQYPHLLYPDFLSFTQACSAFPGSMMSGFFY